MAVDNRPEVNLEICSGFLRIPTNDLIYNIKVLASAESSTTRVIEKIVEVEKRAEPVPVPPAPKPAAPEPTAPLSQADDYYQQAALQFYRDLKKCQESYATTEQEDNTSNGLNDLAEMAGELREVLNGIKKSLPPTTSNGGGQDSPLAALKAVAAKIAQARKLAEGPVSETAPEPGAKNEPAPTAASEKHTRYLFNFDAVFQTIYELCTNETVKDHVQKARAQADDIFAKETFYDALSPKVAKLAEDDGFFTIPMSDIFKSLDVACSDKGISNLLKKMDQQQSTIFLDQFLPLEVPPTEEIEIPAQAAATGGEASAASSGNNGIAAILAKIETEINSINIAGQYGPPENLVDGIDNAVNITASIACDAGQIARVSKIDSQFRWLPVKTATMFMDNLLSQKDGDPHLSFADGEKKAKAVTAEFNTQETEKLDLLLRAVNEPDDEEDDDDDGGEVGQDEIDRLLEEMG
ncbi:MAG: hypothetical protein GXP59_08515 [Deltaproteobacteria bacterium]|nr:hypothetical protein [Deltaproteobacteria bacterium]